jgi:hypothetical protein
MAWSHPEEIFVGYEIESLFETVTFLPEAPHEIVSYLSSIAPSQSVFTTSDSILGILAESVNSDLIGLYPLESITYVTGTNTENVVTQWDDVPLGATMKEFIPHQSTEFIFVVDVTCNYLDLTVPATPVPVQVQASLTVTIWHHYDINQIILKQKVQQEIGDASC